MLDTIYLLIYLFNMKKEIMATLNSLRFELAQIETQQRRLAAKKAQIVKSIEALAPLTTEEPTQENLSLADAIRTVIGSHEVNRPGTLFTPRVVRDLLREMGFDLTPYKNHMASIHTAMSRMQKAGELEPAKQGEFEGGFRWKGKIINRAFYGDLPDVPNPFGKTLGAMLTEPKKK